MCWQNHQCSTEVPSTLKATTEASLILPELHTPAPTWAWQLPCSSLSAKVAWRKDIGKPSVIPARKIQSTTPVDSQSKGTSGQYGKKGKKADLIGVYTGEPPCDEIFLDDVHAPHTNEAYTTVHLPALASNMGIASLWVKVDTEASRNVLPMCLFRHPCPDHIDKQVTQMALMWATLGSLPTIVLRYPLFGSLHGPIIWQPGSHSAQPHNINCCWYMADTPGPAILGLPSCERLEVVKMNYAVKVIQDTSCLLGPTPTPPTPKKTVTTCDVFLRSVFTGCIWVDCAIGGDTHWLDCKFMFWGVKGCSCDCVFL